jgi:hypothetical protein
MLIPVYCRGMLCAPSQKIQRVRQHRQNCRQRTLRPCRAAWQVHNQRACQRPAHSTTQRSKRRVQQPIGAHPFSQSVDQSFADQPRSLRSHIPGSQPRTPRCHNQIRTRCMAPQRRGNQIQLVGQCLLRRDTHSGGFQQLADSRSGEIDLLPPRATVADRQYNCTNIGRKALSHASSLRVSTKFQKIWPRCFFCKEA